MATVRYNNVGWQTRLAVSLVLALLPPDHLYTSINRTARSPFKHGVRTLARSRSIERGSPWQISPTNALLKVDTGIGPFRRRRLAPTSPPRRRRHPKRNPCRGHPLRCHQRKRRIIHRAHSLSRHCTGSALSHGSTLLLREEEEASVGHCNPAYVSMPNALARAQALRPPVPVRTYGGEHEGNDFWDKNEPLIQQALEGLL